MWFHKTSIPPPSHGMVLKIRGGGGLEEQISKGCGGEKSNIFPESPRALSERNLPISHLRFDNQQINDLQFILVYSNVICTFSGHF